MPLSLLEAMSYGCTCLVSDIEENTQITRSYATIFKKGNIEDLKNKLLEILNSDTRIREQEIQNNILERYDWNQIVKETQELYKK